MKLLIKLNRDFYNSIFQYQLQLHLNKSFKKQFKFAITIVLNILLLM